MNYGKTSPDAAVWHRIRPFDDDDPSYCGLGMLSRQHWAEMAEQLPAGATVCMRCERSTLAWA